MARFIELEAQAFQLPEAQRAIFDEEIAEAMQRAAELDRDPSAGMTLEEFKTALAR